MEAKAHVKYLRISPRKVKIVADLIRGKSAAQPGDLAFYPDDSHIGIIVGRNEAGKLLVCHCASGQNNVVITEFSVSGFTAVGRPDIFD